MMGDSRLGTKDSIQIRELAALDIQHPLSSATRLNIAENESPVVADRIFVDYRHFHNVATLQFPGIAPGATRSVPIDSWTIGMEKKFSDVGSLEFRLPINYQLASNLDVSQIAQANGIAVTQLPLNNNDTSLGNLALILKRSWLQTETIYSSVGLGVNTPTASDVSVRTTINDPNFGGGLGAPGVPYQLQLTSRMNNETVSLTPFLATGWQPTDEIYGLGFLQLDVPLNESRVSAVGTSSFGGQPPININLQGRLAQQVILRTNLGVGRWLWKSDTDRLLNSLGLQTEMHYSTTLNDADRVASPPPNPNQAGRVSLPAFGSNANRLDILNASLGVQAVMGMTLVTHSFVVPIKNDFDRGFDFEYALMVNRRF